MNGVNLMGYDLDEVGKEIHTPKKSSSYEMCEDIIKEIVRMRQFSNVSQNELADMSGVRQPMIARIERGINTPNMSTVIKLLAAFGKALYIGNLNGVELEDGEAVRRWIRKAPEDEAEESSVDDYTEAESSTAQPDDSEALQQ